MLFINILLLFLYEVNSYELSVRIKFIELSQIYINFQIL